MISVLSAKWTVVSRWKVLLIASILFCNLIRSICLWNPLYNCSAEILTLHKEGKSGQCIFGSITSILLLTCRIFVKICCLNSDYRQLDPYSSDGNNWMMFEIVSKLIQEITSKIEKESSFFSLFLRIDPFLLFDWLKFYFSSSNESTENVTLLMLLVDDDLLLMFLSSFLLISKGCSIFLSYFSGKWVFFLTIGFLFEEVCLKRFFFFILFLT